MDLSLGDAARMLGVTGSRIARWIKDEGLPAFMINGRYRFNRVDLLEWANRRKIPVAALYQLPESGDIPYRLDFLLEGNIHYDVPGADKKAVLAAVAERLPLASPRDKALAAQALGDRGDRGSTLVDGIALPHARSPLIFGVDRPILTLCFLKNTVSFNEGGDPPVQIVWTLVSPTIRAHLAILAKVAAALNDADFRRLLGKAATAPELLARLSQIG
jgi:PTS system nitrogen regulatory IIA component